MSEASPAPRLFALDGQVALVTGAAGGLGRAIALAYAQHGARLVLSDRKGDGLREVAARCESLGTAVHTVAADLAETAQVQRLAEQAQAAFGRIDLLVCNAGMQGPAGPLLAVPAEDWARVFQVNLASAHALCAALVPAMGARGHGRVVLMASIAALRGNGAIGLYGLSKAALAQMARNLAVEWSPRGVCVNAIAPGLIRTPLADGLMANAAFMARRLAATPLRRVGEPHEVAGVAVMLASAAGGFITGQMLVVDGGTLISDGS
ncbi:NAD(P)-dependent dehydrogenase (short-subunit alcohol dehydrogenase family) [Pseudacidovorax intermedius]|uniref:NAD(P)-dependent dehydrogenase (Short-subunit alcohol dehydrogenase family) n=1 Tax=Pseudacidovorax intermedius TaxID=433924 RepID=A0A370FE36_9BURK|nr:glucose 1-dehydrogenase [Pseudacidovorax intermedius]RDI24311.1 NAD(P)-dependent dehydrogenase (short-subunit alcohol dehydrogenase family) [Pseudacidovorax intermedius]